MVNCSSKLLGLLLLEKSVGGHVARSIGRTAFGPFFSIAVFIADS
jgi:hypothetical protein